MPQEFLELPRPQNEHVKSYAPGSPERKSLKDKIADLDTKIVDIPMYIGDQQIMTDQTVDVTAPHDHGHVLARRSVTDDSYTLQAIEAALAAKPGWEKFSLAQRQRIFQRAADRLASVFRDEINAATMLGQSKNAFQAEIDAACELIDFWKFNNYYATEIFKEQPGQAKDMINETEFRPLEGFVYALTPFNFTSIAGNLPTSMALMGNTVVWKPSNTAAYSAHVIMKVLKDAGLPDGVINLVYPKGTDAARVIFEHPDFAGLHFTGSTAAWEDINQAVGRNYSNYRNYPKMVGETGGKDFILAHNSADPEALVTALVRGAFEYQGQKCSAASRAYIPESMWNTIETPLLDKLGQIKVGPPQDFRNFVNAVIDKDSFDNISGYINRAVGSADARIIHGGNADDSVGYFIEPTVIQALNPNYESMREEIFGPVLSVYVYPDGPVYWQDMLNEVDSSKYALTGAIFAGDRRIIEDAKDALRYSAGNFYINDKPTGAVVGQQPFGGARKSGTNDKAGSKLNLLRWVSPRTIKENTNPPTDPWYPYMQEA